MATARCASRRSRICSSAGCRRSVCTTSTRALAATGFGLAVAGTIADVVSCPGAESCRLAVTQSRGLGRLLGDHLREHPDVAAAGGPADIKISGCPNGCGQHHIASIGFQGSIRRLGERAVPQYFVMVGGGADANGASFGRIVAKVPARRAPRRWIGSSPSTARSGVTDERLAAFFRRADVARAEEGARRSRSPTEETADAADFIDLAEDKAFTPEVLEGECSA